MISTSQRVMLLVSSLLVAANTGSAFVVPSLQRRPAFSTESTSKLQETDMGNMESIEFKIYPDGRVEETVRGIKGGNCHKVTESINEALGKVIATEPTEEMYEQEVVIDQTLTETVGDGGSSSSDAGWEGKSTW